MTANVAIDWRFRAGVSLADRSDGTLTLTVDDGQPLVLRSPSSELTQALLRLRDGADKEALLGGLGDIDYADALLHYYLSRMRRHGLLFADIRCDDEVLATLVPRIEDFNIPVPAVGGRWQLSRFAYLRRRDEDLVLECPDAPCVVYLHSPDLVGWLNDARRPVAPETGTPAAAVLGLLTQFKFLENAEVEETEARQSWEFHDRLFHDRARRNDDLGQHGGTYRFQDRFPSPPAIRPPHPGEAIPLGAPPPAASRPLLDIMEERRSRREMGDPPVTRDQVAELLYRVARIRETIPAPAQEMLRRPYPSGGALHELEFYVAVGACDGLADGFYHYRGDEHALVRLATGDAAAQQMLAGAATAWCQQDLPPQCLVVLSSRLPRLAWKYEGIAYKISLMNAGVVLQCLYLVCTDMGLNGAAVGSGDPRLFTAATNASSWEETSIAEFGFGSRPA